MSHALRLHFADFLNNLHSFVSSGFLLTLCKNAEDPTFDVTLAEWSEACRCYFTSRFLSGSHSK